MGGSTLGTQTIYEFLNHKIKKKFLFIDNLQNKQKKLPAVTHVDGTGRLQTVDKKTNKLYYELINSFKELTGVPMLLNTSFNENEPIVNTLEEAINCFLRTKMDLLVIGNYILKR